MFVEELDDFPREFIKFPPCLILLYICFEELLATILEHLHEVEVGDTHLIRVTALVRTKLSL